MEPEPNMIEALASDWVTREDAGLTPGEKGTLEEWLARDPRHHGAYIRAKAAWLDTERLASLAGGANYHQVAPTASRARSQHRGHYLLLAACVALVVIVAATAFWVHFPRSRIYVSEIGEVRQIMLSDGSQLILNTDTEATVLFKTARREVALDHGEALFKVAHDAARPFVVRANNVMVTAIGTAFAVRVDDGRTDVVVTEGTVEISRTGAQATQEIQRVSANHRVVLAATERHPDVETLNPEAVNRQLAWRDGMAAFAGEPLSVAVSEINRHTRYPILIDDPKLAARPVIGIFHANDTEAFATAVAATFDAEVVHLDGAIHIRIKPHR